MSIKKESVSNYTGYTAQNNEEPKNLAETRNAPSEKRPIKSLSRSIVIARRDIDIRKRAEELAEEQLREEERRGAPWEFWHWGRKIKYRTFEEYYRQKFIERASYKMKEYNNAYLTMDVVRNKAVNVDHNLFEEKEAGHAKIQQIKTQINKENDLEGLETGEQIIKTDGQLKNDLIKSIIIPLVEKRVCLLTDKNIESEKDLQDALREFSASYAKNHPNDNSFNIVFGSDATKYAKNADYFATDILEVTNKIKDDIYKNKKYEITDIYDKLDIYLSNPDWAAKTEARFSATDKTIAWLEKKRLPANPLVIGAVFSLATWGGLRLAGAGARTIAWTVPIAGLIPAAVFAGARRGQELKIDRASHNIEMAYGKAIPDDANRRKKLEEFAYDTAYVGHLLNGGERKMPDELDKRGMNEILSSDPAEENNRKTLIERMAEIETRLDLSALKKVDLIRFEQSSKVEQGRLALIKAIVEGKRALKKQGVSQEDVQKIENEYRQKWKKHLLDNINFKDKKFNNYKNTEMIATGILAAGIGIAAGFAVKEIIQAVADLSNPPRLEAAELAQNTNKINSDNTHVNFPKNETNNDFLQKSALTIHDRAEDTKIADKEFSKNIMSSREIRMHKNVPIPLSASEIINIPSPKETICPAPSEIIMIPPSSEIRPVPQGQIINIPPPSEIPQDIRQPASSIINIPSPSELPPQELLRPEPAIIQIPSPPELPPQEIPMPESPIINIPPPSEIPSPEVRPQPGPIISISEPEVRRLAAEEEIIPIIPLAAAPRFPLEPLIYPEEALLHAAKKEAVYYAFPEKTKLRNIIRIKKPEKPKTTKQPLYLPLTQARAMLPAAQEHKETVEQLSYLFFPDIKKDAFYKTPEAFQGISLKEVIKKGKVKKAPSEKFEAKIRTSARERKEEKEQLKKADKIYIVINDTKDKDLTVNNYLSAVKEKISQIDTKTPITIIVSTSYGDAFDSFLSANIYIVKTSRGKTMQKAFGLAQAEENIKPIILSFENIHKKTPVIIKETVSPARNLNDTAKYIEPKVAAKKQQEKERENKLPKETQKSQEQEAGIKTVKAYRYFDQEFKIEAQKEGEEALNIIHNAFEESNHVYITLSGAIGDVSISSAYIDGIRQYAEKSKQAKKITLLVPFTTAKLVEPLSQKYGYEIVKAERHKCVDKALKMIKRAGEKNALVLDFDFTQEHGPNPILEEAGNNNFVVHELFSSSVGLYKNDQLGSQRFSEYLAELLNMPDEKKIEIHPTLALPENADLIYEKMKKRHKIDEDKKQVAVVIEASASYKRYSLSNWLKTIKEIEDGNTEFNIIFNAYSGNYKKTELFEIFKQIKNIRLISLNIQEAMVLLQKQNLVLTNDTGLSHIAAIVENGPKVISLHAFGNTPNIWVSNTERQYGIWSGSEYVSVNTISPDIVIKKALEFLKNKDM